MGVPPGSSLKKSKEIQHGSIYPFTEFQHEFIGLGRRFYIVERRKNTAKYFTNLKKFDDPFLPV
jgi:hypothetical protein